MKRETCFWALLITGMLVTLLLVMWVAPGWGMPDQSAVRQTVPELTPQAYLPLVLRNFEIKP